jgi:hypothetical protein
MGLTTNIEAFTPDTDPEFQKHKKILLLCIESDVSLPKETAGYFGSDEPYFSLIDERLSVSLKDGVHYREYQNDSCSGYEVDLKSLPEGVTKLRFRNCW